jgi:hypothetical protein
MLLNVENVHLQCDNDLVDDDELHLAAIVIQIHKWKPNNKNSICWDPLQLMTIPPLILRSHKCHIASSIDQFHKKLVTLFLTIILFYRKGS